jgi:uncharacterized membrane protein
MRQRIRNYFITGLLVTVPIVITYLTITWLFSVIDGLMEPLWFRYFQKHIPGVGFITTILVILIAGFLATNVIGRSILKGVEDILLRIPVSRSIYATTKQLMDAFSPTGKAGFKRVIMVKHPDDGGYSLGFLTKELAIEGVDMVAAYIPTNHVYFGNIVLVKRESVVFTDMTVEEGLRAILTAGTALPEKIEPIKSS